MTPDFEQKPLPTFDDEPWLNSRRWPQVYAAEGGHQLPGKWCVVLVWPGQDRAVWFHLE